MDAVRQKTLKDNSKVFYIFNLKFRFVYPFFFVNPLFVLDQFIYQIKTSVNKVKFARRGNKNVRTISENSLRRVCAIKIEIKHHLNVNNTYGKYGCFDSLRIIWNEAVGDLCVKLIEIELMRPKQNRLYHLYERKFH